MSITDKMEEKRITWENTNWTIWFQKHWGTVKYKYSIKLEIKLKKKFFT